MPESSVVVVKTVVQAVANAIDTVVVANIAVDIAASSDDILAEIAHGLPRYLSLYIYHVLLWV